MTVNQIYNETIKSLPSNDRLLLARLILDDITSYPTRLEIRDHNHLEELLLSGLHSGPGIEATPDYWELLETDLIGGQSLRTISFSI